MPMSTSYQKRLSNILPQIVDTFGTPFHIYDEKGIKETCKKLTTAFENIEGFKEFFGSHRCIYSFSVSGCPVTFKSKMSFLA